MFEYKSYTHLERLDKVDTEGILNGLCAITAKVDGSNAVIWSDGETVYAGSRKRKLSDTKDNAGFYNWVVYSSEDEAMKLRAFVLNNPRYMVYGEWLGSGKFIGSIKDYDKSALRHMYIFDVYDTKNEKYLYEDEWRYMLAGWELEPWFVESFGVFDDLTVEKVAEIANNNHFLLPEDKVGEGVTIHPQYDYKNPYGHYIIGKFVLDEFKQEKSKPKKEKIVSDNIEQDIVDAYMLDSELSKSKAKVCVAMDIAEFDTRNGQCIGRMMNLCYNDLLEECKNWVKDFRNPTVDFAKLKRACDTKVRNYLGL